jgi:hypothetical protein
VQGHALERLAPTDRPQRGVLAFLVTDLDNGGGGIGSSATAPRSAAGMCHSSVAKRRCPAVRSPASSGKAVHEPGRSVMGRAYGCTLPCSWTPAASSLSYVQPVRVKPATSVLLPAPLPPSSSNYGDTLVGNPGDGSTPRLRTLE